MRDYGLGLAAWGYSIALLLTALGCSAGAEDSARSRRPSGSAGTSSKAPDLGLNGGNGAIGVGDGASNGNGSACQELEVDFEPKIPTVFVLVDRSGSMFSSQAWDPLRDGVLEVVEQLQADVRFGFGAFTGEQGEACPIFDKVDAALNNHAPIAALYGGLKQPRKGETPTMRVLENVKDILVNDPTDGAKYILFVTDGQPDYCGDGNELCPVDAVVYRLQELQALGIHTFVFGLKSAASTISEATLQAFANAGAGQAVVAPSDPKQIHDQCFYGGDPNAQGWKADFAAAGRQKDQTLGVYAAAAGTAKVFRPDPSDKAALTNEIRAVIAGVKSCVFELAGKIKVDLKQLDLADVLIGGSEVPLSQENGFRMNTETQLELVGAACESWRDPAQTKIEFKFPCELILPK